MCIYIQKHFLFRLYPQLGHLYPEGIELLKRADDADQVRNVVELFQVQFLFPFVSIDKYVELKYCI